MENDGKDKEIQIRSKSGENADFEVLMKGFKNLLQIKKYIIPFHHLIKLIL